MVSRGAFVGGSTNCELKATMIPTNRGRRERRHHNQARSRKRSTVIVHSFSRRSATDRVVGCRYSFDRDRRFIQSFGRSKSAFEPSIGAVHATLHMRSERPSSTTIARRSRSRRHVAACRIVHIGSAVRLHDGVTAKEVKQVPGVVGAHESACRLMASSTCRSR